MPIRIAVADDHPLVLAGLEQLFQLHADIEVVARCRNGDEALESVRRLQPDVLVLDLMMPSRDGLGVLHAVQREQLQTRVVVLTAVLQDDQLLEAIGLGAHGVVLKETAPQELLSAVRAVHGGGEWLDQALGGRALRELRKSYEPRTEPATELTARETEIVRMVAEGLRNRAIADKLFISEGTVKVHLHNIYEKLGVGGRFELIACARKRGVI